MTEELPDLQSLVRADRHPAPCVCCQKATSGRYIGLPSCLPCYKEGRLREFLDRYGELWSADKFLEHLQNASDIVDSWPEWKQQVLGQPAKSDAPSRGSRPPDLPVCRHGNISANCRQCGRKVS